MRCRAAHDVLVTQLLPRACSLTGSRIATEHRVSTNGFLEYDKDSVAVRPLAELPMLRLINSAWDVRGWEVHGQDGRRLGIVTDLLVDIDRLRADTLLVRSPVAIALTAWWLCRSMD